MSECDCGIWQYSQRWRARWATLVLSRSGIRRSAMIPNRDVGVLQHLGERGAAKLRELGKQHQAFRLQALHLVGHANQFPVFRTVWDEGLLLALGHQVIISPPEILGEPLNDLVVLA